MEFVRCAESNIKRIRRAPLLRRLFSQFECGLNLLRGRMRVNSIGRDRRETTQRGNARTE
jgi:hypothetical protein